ncbi:hypothetical protein POTOM_031461 [Populus tomentosa]|uniref:Uncharacterized protein n=1 Tax=Populus tomentosa TaxID=118781 RepID=A0A8X7Z456_POPTO|nr:hypothetical protein POTOM_031461 [Populus tomentosa]
MCQHISTVYRRIKEGALRPHSNAMKPHLTEANRKASGTILIQQGNVRLHSVPNDMEFLEEEYKGCIVFQMTWNSLKKSIKLSLIYVRFCFIPPDNVLGLWFSRAIQSFCNSKKLLQQFKNY